MYLFLVLPVSPENSDVGMAQVLGGPGQTFWYLLPGERNLAVAHKSEQPGIIRALPTSCFSWTAWFLLAMSSPLDSSCFFLWWHIHLINRFYFEILKFYILLKFTLFLQMPLNVSRRTVIENIIPHFI